MNLFDKGAIEAFRNTIVFRGVMDCELVYGTLPLQVLINLKFAATVTLKFLNMYVVLSTEPCFEVLVAVEGLIFGLDKVNFGELAASIHLAPHPLIPSGWPSCGLFPIHIMSRRLACFPSQAQYSSLTHYPPASSLHHM